MNNTMNTYIEKLNRKYIKIHELMEQVEELEPTLTEKEIRETALEWYKLGL